MSVLPRRFGSSLSLFTLTQVQLLSRPRRDHPSTAISLRSAAENARRPRVRVEGTSQGFERPKQGLRAFRAVPRGNCGETRGANGGHPYAPSGTGRVSTALGTGLHSGASWPRPFPARTRCLRQCDRRISRDHCKFFQGGRSLRNVLSCGGDFGRAAQRTWVEPTAGAGEIPC